MLTHRKKFGWLVLAFSALLLAVVSAEAARDNNRQGRRGRTGQRDARLHQRHQDNPARHSEPRSDRRRGSSERQTKRLEERQNRENLVTSRNSGSMTFSRGSGSMTFNRGSSTTRSPVTRSSTVTERSQPRRGVSFTRDKSWFVRKGRSMHGLPDRSKSRPSGTVRRTTDRRSADRKIVNRRIYRRKATNRRPSRIYSHIGRRNYGYPVRYRYGSNIFVRYVRPRYHRKYIFVSIGGYWPVSYSSVRYYWYGVHPYHWYGSYPTAYQTQGDTYNYYTYNYNTDSQPTSGYTGSLQGVDETTFEDVRQKLAAQQEQQPQPETLVDSYFEDGVAAFEQEDYETAAKAFADAVVLEPDDLILPFAYVQALFADEQYGQAAEVLRSALEDMSADEQGLYFPRGLYTEDETLFEQIEQLQRKVDVFNYDYDLKLLLGYQLIGVEKYDQARQVLDDVNRVNKDSADILIELIDDIEQQVESDL